MEIGVNFSVYLQVPKEKREYEPNANAHEPGNSEKSNAVWAGLEVVQHHEPFRHFTVLLRKHCRVRDSSFTDLENR